MRCLSTQDQRVLAEFNRRVLAGRPVPALILTQLELLYEEVTDAWGPPGSSFAKEEPNGPTVSAGSISTVHAVGSPSGIPG